MGDNVEIFGSIIHITDNAVLITDGDNKIWIPKSLTNLEDNVDVGDDVILEIPEYFAIKERLI